MRSLKYMLPILLLVSGAGAPLAAQAQSASASAAKIAVVNVQAIMHDSTAAKSVHEQLDAKQRGFQSELSKKEEGLHREEQDLAKQRGTLSKEAFEQKVKSFQDKVTAYQKEVEGKKAAFDNAYERAVGQIQKAVTDIVSELAKERGFETVLAGSQVLYIDPSLDITAEVLSRLNQRLPRVDARFDAPAAKQ